MPEVEAMASVDAVTSWALESGTSFVLRLLGGLLILALGWVIAKWAQSGVVRSMERSKLDVALGRFLSQLIRWMILVGAAVSALATMGFEVTTFVAVLGAAGFAVGLALQGTLGHFASGVMLLIFRPLTIGEFVGVGGTTGTVREIGLFATTLLTPDNQTVFIPNGAVTGATIVNFTRQGTRRAEVDVGVAYGTALADVEAACIAAAGRVPEIHAEPAVGFAFVEMADSSLNFKFRAWCAAADFLLVQHKLRSEIYNELNARGIEIPFPQVVVHKGE